MEKPSENAMFFAGFFVMCANLGNHVWFRRCNNRLARSTQQSAGGAM